MKPSFGKRSYAPIERMTLLRHMGKRAVFVDGEFIILYQKDTIILSKLPKLMGTTLDSICRLEDMEAVATRILEIHQELSQLRSYLADCEKPSTQL